MPTEIPTATMPTSIDILLPYITLLNMSRPKRSVPNQYFELEKSGDYGMFETVDMDTVKFTLELPAHSKREFEYTHVQHHGTRQD